MECAQCLDCGFIVQPDEAAKRKKTDAPTPDDPQEAETSKKPEESFVAEDEVSREGEPVIFSNLSDLVS